MTLLTDTVKMERMIAHTPSDGAILGGRGLIVRLTLDTQIPTNANQTSWSATIARARRYAILLSLCV